MKRRIYREDSPLDREITDLYNKIDAMENDPNRRLIDYRRLNSKLQDLIAQRDSEKRIHVRRELEPETDLAFMTESSVSAKQTLLEILAEIDSMFPNKSDEEIISLLSFGETTENLDDLKTKLLIHLIRGELKPY